AGELLAKRRETLVGSEGAGRLRLVLVRGVGGCDVALAGALLASGGRSLDLRSGSVLLGDKRLVGLPALVRLGVLRLPGLALGVEALAPLLGLGVEALRVLVVALGVVLG